jgi:hypothetical protein
LGASKRTFQVPSSTFLRDLPLAVSGVGIKLMPPFLVEDEGTTFRAEEGALRNFVDAVLGVFVGVAALLLLLIMILLLLLLLL